MTEPPRGALNLYETYPGPCPYLPGRMERKIFTVLERGATGSLASLLTASGFRRNQGMFYRQHCDGCRACLAVRLLVATFRPDKHMHRILRRNADLHCTVIPAKADRALYDIFHAYLLARHSDGGMAEMSYDEFVQMIEDFPDDTKLLLCQKGDEILGAMMFDELADGTSAVYSFFSPAEEKRSLGTWMILQLAELTQETARPHLYLGFWIKQSRKMAYKAKFQPLQVLVNHQWVPFDAAQGAEGTEDKERNAE
jgi:arginine-tRNA-protein transferase